MTRGVSVDLSDLRAEFRFLATAWGSPSTVILTTREASLDRRLFVNKIGQAVRMDYRSENICGKPGHVECYGLPHMDWKLT